MANFCESLLRVMGHIIFLAMAPFYTRAADDQTDDQIMSVKAGNVKMQRVRGLVVHLCFEKHPQKTKGHICKQGQDELKFSIFTRLSQSGVQVQIRSANHILQRISLDTSHRQASCA